MRTICNKLAQAFAGQVHVPQVGAAIRDIRIGMVRFLEGNGHPKTAAHRVQVGTEARKIAERYGLNGEHAAIAGWLHDISAVFPSATRADVADGLGIDVLPEERTFPMIIHQKLSVVIAQELFGVEEPAILSAIGCHTTLKPDATPLDKAVFVADKIRWDQSGAPPFLDELRAALTQSLDAAALCYLTYLFQNKSQLQVIHPWAWAAYETLGDP